jgi:hypothetical protein
MASLGEFGSAVREADPDRERDTIQLCGVEFTVAERVDPLAAMEFAEAAANGGDTNSMGGMAAMLSLIRGSIDEGDWPRFRSVVRQHRPDAEVLMELAMACLSRDAGRPTQQVSDSLPGPPPTSESSKAPSSFGAWSDSPFGRRELAAHPELYEGLSSTEESLKQFAS